MSSESESESESKYVKYYKGSYDYDRKRRQVANTLVWHANESLFSTLARKFVGKYELYTNTYERYQNMITTLDEILVWRNNQNRNGLSYIPPLIKEVLFEHLDEEIYIICATCSYDRILKYKMSELSNKLHYCGELDEDIVICPTCLYICPNCNETSCKHCRIKCAKCCNNLCDHCISSYTPILANCCKKVYCNKCMVYCKTCNNIIDDLCEKCAYDEWPVCFGHACAGNIFHCDACAPIYTCDYCDNEFCKDCKTSFLECNMCNKKYAKLVYPIIIATKSNPELLPPQ